MALVPVRAEELAGASAIDPTLESLTARLAELSEVEAELDQREAACVQAERELDAASSPAAAPRAASAASAPWTGRPGAPWSAWLPSRSTGGHTFVPPPSQTDASAGSPRTRQAVKLVQDAESRGQALPWLPDLTADEEFIPWTVPPVLGPPLPADRFRRVTTAPGGAPDSDVDAAWHRGNDNAFGNKPRDARTAAGRARVSGNVQATVDYIRMQVTRGTSQFERIVFLERLNRLRTWTVRADGSVTDVNAVDGLTSHVRETGVDVYRMETWECYDCLLLPSGAIVVPQYRHTASGGKIEFGPDRTSLLLDTARDATGPLSASASLILKKETFKYVEVHPPDCVAVLFTDRRVPPTMSPREDVAQDQLDVAAATFAAVYHGTNGDGRRANLRNTCIAERMLYFAASAPDDAIARAFAPPDRFVLGSENIALHVRGSLIFTVKRGQHVGSTSPLIRAARPLLLSGLEAQPVAPPASVLLVAPTGLARGNMANHEQVAGVLAEWADKRGLTLDVWHPESADALLGAKAFARARAARVVVQIQGPSVYAMTASEPGTSAVLIGGSYFASTYLHSIYADPWIVASPGALGSPSVTVDLAALKCTLAMMDRRDATGTRPSSASLPECTGVTAPASLPVCPLGDAACAPFSFR